MFIRCIFILFIDLVKKKPKIYFDKKNLFYLITKTLTIKCPFYLKVWFQTMFEWRLFSYIFGNTIFNLNLLTLSSILFKKKAYSINKINEKTENFLLIWTHILSKKIN